VEPDFVTEVEGEAIAAELEAVAKAYGYPYDGESRVHLVSTGGEVETTLDGVVNNLRVTGRLERPDLGQGLPPWGYGDGFDAMQLPPAIGELAQRIASCGAFAVGPVRDVTVNIRESSFFQTGPTSSYWASAPPRCSPSLRPMPCSPAWESRHAGVTRGRSG